MKALMPFLIAVALCCQAWADDWDDKKAAFRQKMMPKVGKVVTVTGKFTLGKGPDFILTDDGGMVHLDSARVKTINDFSQLIGTRLTATGTLQIGGGGPPQYNDKGEIMQGTPEHFFMIIEQSTIRRAGVER